MRLLIYGHSHTHALYEGARRLLRQDQLDAVAQIRLPTRVRPQMGVRIWDRLSGETSPSSADPMKALDAVGACDTIILLPAGGRLVAGAQVNPYDAFAVIEESGSDVDYTAESAAQVVPLTVIREAFRRTLAQGVIREPLDAVLEWAHRTSRIGSNTPTVILLAPPPPQDPLEVRRKWPQSVDFASRLQGMGVAPDAVRLTESTTMQTVYAVLLRTYAELADNLQVAFMPPPLDKVTAPDGSLKMEYASHDFVHANSAYGAVYMEAVLRERCNERRLASSL
jgi:hypothetical protein